MLPCFNASINTAVFTSAELPPEAAWIAAVDSCTALAAAELKLQVSFAVVGVNKQWQMDSQFTEGSRGASAKQCKSIAKLDGGIVPCSDASAEGKGSHQEGRSTGFHFNVMPGTARPVPEYTVA